MDPMGVAVPSELKRLGRESFPAREVLLGPQLPGSPVVGFWHATDIYGINLVSRHLVEL